MNEMSVILISGILCNIHDGFEKRLHWKENKSIAADVMASLIQKRDKHVFPRNALRGGGVFFMKVDFNLSPLKKGIINFNYSFHLVLESDLSDSWVCVCVLFFL